MDTWKWSIDYAAKSFMTKAEFFFCQVSENHKKGCKFFGKKTSKWVCGQVEWSFDTTAGDKLVKTRNFFAPCTNVIKKFVQKFLFSQKKVSCGHIECCFDDAADFSEETPIGFVQSPTLKKQKETEIFFSREGSFLQKVWGEEDCSFDKLNEKFLTKSPFVLAQCPKMQNVKK